jgi:hypothetical protein
MNPAPTADKLLADIFGIDGYSAAFSIGSDELTAFRDAIFDQWIARIEDRHPELATQFRHAGLEQYHRLSHLVSHEKLWPKNYRVLPRETVTTLMQFDFMRRLRAEFGGAYDIANVILSSGEIPDYPEIYWRLVRPNVASDVGALHMDKWFHDIFGNGQSFYGDKNITVKMWLSIFTEPGLNGLYVVPGSHRKAWRVKHTVGADGQARPSLDEALGDYREVLIPVVPGQAILFSENLLHGGAPNGGQNSRISVEITFILPRSAITEKIHLS